MTPLLAALAGGAAVLLWWWRPPPDDLGAGRPDPRRSWWHRLRSWIGRGVRRRPRGDDDWVADLAEVVAVGLRAGLDVASAVRVAAGTPAVAAGAPWLAARVGDAAPGAVPDLTPPGGGGIAADLEVLARAWRLSEATGAGAAATTAAAAGAVRERATARQRTRAALAGPTASMRLLSALPLAGPLVALLVGLDPAAVYAGVAPRVAVLAGLLLTGLGWWWSRSMLVRAARPRGTQA